MAETKLQTEDFFHNPILILGVPRSGTSMIAGILEICGAWLGNTIPGGGVENPRGFFENTYLREAVNKKILETAGSDPSGVKSLPYFEELPQTNGLEENIRGLLKYEGYDFQTPWAFKEPKLSLIWPNYAAIFPQAHWLIVRRPREHIVASCLNTSFMKRQNNDPIFWYHWVDAYLERLDFLKSTNLCWSEIWSDSVIEGDFSDIKQLVQNYQLNWQEEQVINFINPKFWHFK